jgi:uncharacterized membrane protein
MWSNMALLFSLSLVPFATAWFGESPGALAPVIIYVAVQLACAVSYFGLTRAMLRIHPSDGPLAVALGRDRKGKVSLGIYLAALALSLVSPWIGIALIVVVAVMWLIPDNRVVRTLESAPTR